jgi:hypothetical protein
MNDIYDPTNDFKFENLSMTSPSSVSGGVYFSKFLMNRNPLYIQTPKCSTKSGVIKSGKKIHMDLVFTNVNEEFIQWIETLETTTRKLIYANREKWFDMELDEDDIESYFTPTVKLFKSGKQYLVRVNMSQRINGTPAVKIYDEAEVDVAPEALDDKTTMITILEVQGVRCSAKSFQIELVLKQIMVIKPLEIFEKCIIKERSKQGSSNNNLESSSLKVQMTNSLAAEEPNIQISVNENTSLNKDDVEESVNDVETTPNIQNSEQSESNVDIPMSNVDIPMSNVDIPMSNVTQEPTENKYELEPFEIDLDDTNIKAEDTVYLKDKTEVYYEMYKNARKKAKLAKSLALSSFMEARRIKNMYMLDDLEDSDEDDEIDLENMENEGSDEDE